MKQHAVERKKGEKTQELMWEVSLLQKLQNYYTENQDITVRVTHTE